MVLVCNTGPIIALGKLDRCSLLQQLGFSRILAPPSVQKELLAKIGPESAAIEAVLDSILEVDFPQAVDLQVKAVAAGLDRGERDVILLGVAVGPDTVLLLDDQSGRRIAKTLGLQILGTAGLLLLAKQQGCINAVVPLLDQLRERGYWLSDALIEEVRRRADE